MKLAMGSTRAQIMEQLTNDMKSIRRQWEIVREKIHTARDNIQRLANIDTISAKVVSESRVVEELRSLFEEIKSHLRDEKVELDKLDVKRKSLKVGYLNIQGAILTAREIAVGISEKRKTTKIQEIRERYLAGSFDILFISESKLLDDYHPAQAKCATEYLSVVEKKRKELEVKNYVLVMLDRNVGQPGQGGGGILVYIRSDISYTVVEKNTSSGVSPTQYVYLYLDVLDTHVVGVYYPPYSPKEYELFYMLERFQNDEKVIVLGGVNLKKIPTAIEGFVGQNRNYRQLINEPTQFRADGSGSRFDHIYTTATIDEDKPYIHLDRSMHDLRLTDHALIYLNVEYGDNEKGYKVIPIRGKHRPSARSIICYVSSEDQT